jgi:hypothetical protein
MVFYRQDGSVNYFYLNVLVFLVNILFGYYHRSPVIVIASVVCLAIIFYLQERNDERLSTHILDQIGMLGVLIPGLVVWFNNEPRKHPIAGTLFLAGMALYSGGLLYKEYGHSPDLQEREYWRLIMHLFSTSGHIALLFEPAVLLMFSK